MDPSGKDIFAREMIEDVDRAAALLKAIANEKRIVILCRLFEGEKSVGELESLLDLSQSALSQHLARLRAAKVVKTRREAQTIFYSLNGEAAAAVLGALHGHFQEADPSSELRHARPSAA